MFNCEILCPDYGPEIQAFYLGRKDTCNIDNNLTCIFTSGKLK